MGTDQNLEKIYDLLEQYDFNELSETDKSFVLTQMSETDYENMRETIKDSKNYFDGKPEIQMDENIYNFLPDTMKKRNSVVRALNYPIQFYKVAASILIILGITFLIYYNNLPVRNGELAIHDTIYIKKTDTVFSTIRDSLKIIKNLIVQVPQKKASNTVTKYLANNDIKVDCKKELCPSDIEKITGLASSNSISQDTSLGDFVVSIK